MNTSTILDLEPKALWVNFSALNAIPRASKKEEKVREFVKEFADRLALPYKEDAIGNIVIYKPASPGMENCKTVAMQSHLDMVHQKNKGTDFNFDTDGIQMYVDSDWVKAKGTTLGADNGIGVATILALLASDTIAHPAIEALFTVDEEAGMGGAKFLGTDLLSADILLNLDTEEDDNLCIGCAGGVDLTATATYTQELLPASTNWVSYQIQLKGLEGGHSGVDIHKGLGNANKLLNRLLYELHQSVGFRLHSFSGGTLRNAIPRESEAIVVVAVDKSETFLEDYQQMTEILKAEQRFTDSNLQFCIAEVAVPKSVLPVANQQDFLQGIEAAINGVFKMSSSIEGLVETSNNIAKVVIKDGSVKISCLSRSSVRSNLWALASSLKSAFELSGMQVTFKGEYPSWEPNTDSEILKVCQATYQELFKEPAIVSAIHAGLECGIIGEKYPNLDMVSFGPTITGAHSPDEKVSISSTQKFWKYTLEVLKNIPHK